jgi:hypothetical protein
MSILPNVMQRKSVASFLKDKHDCSISRLHNEGVRFIDQQHANDLEFERHH